MYTLYISMYLFKEFWNLRGQCYEEVAMVASRQNFAQRVDRWMDGRERRTLGTYG